MGGGGQRTSQSAAREIKLGPKMPEGRDATDSVTQDPFVHGHGEALVDNASHTLEKTMSE